MTPWALLNCPLGQEGVRHRVLPLAKYVPKVRTFFAIGLYWIHGGSWKKKPSKESSAAGLEKTLKVT